VKWLYIETEEAVRIRFNSFLFRVAPSPSPAYECGKRNPLYPIRTASFG